MSLFCSSVNFISASHFCTSSGERHSWRSDLAGPEPSAAVGQVG